MLFAAKSSRFCEERVKRHVEVSGFRFIYYRRGLSLVRATHRQGARDQTCAGSDHRRSTGRSKTPNGRAPVRSRSKNGGTVFFGYDGNYLFVGARGPEYGWSHLYLNYADVPEVYVHHASAALGMIAYRSGKDGKWQSSNPFSWDLRDRVINPELQKKMDDYLAKNFWVANNNNTGNRNEIEFKIKPRSDKPFRIGRCICSRRNGTLFFS